MKAKSNQLFKLAVLFLGIFSFAWAGAFAQSKGKQTMVLIHTSYGNMKAVLYNETPQHRDNFIKLAKEGYFNGTLFHRVIDGFMIQGGDPLSKNAPKGQMLGNGGPSYTIPAEFNKDLIHQKGALAAARDNNPQKASSGSQFYIVQGKQVSSQMLMQMSKNHYTAEQKHIYETVGGTPFLDNEYTVFGQVIEGLDIIDKIASVQKDRNDRPLEDIPMTITVIE